MKTTSIRGYTSNDQSKKGLMPRGVDSTDLILFRKHFSVTTFFCDGATFRYTQYVSGVNPKRHSKMLCVTIMI